MTQTELCEIGYRWTRPTWERSADRSWILIVPSRYLREDETAGTTDGYFDRTQRYYQIFESDGSWLNEFHEMQVERVLRNPRWRGELCSAEHN